MRGGGGEVAGLGARPSSGPFRPCPRAPRGLAELPFCPPLGLDGGPALAQGRLARPPRPCPGLPFQVCQFSPRVLSGCFAFRRRGVDQSSVVHLMPRVSKGGCGWWRWTTGTPPCRSVAPSPKNGGKVYSKKGRSKIAESDTVETRRLPLFLCIAKYQRLFDYT